MLGKIRKTERGLRIIRFFDLYGMPCRLQESLLAVEGCDPGAGAVWLGSIDPESPNGSMHLDRDQVKELIDHLQSWLDGREFSIPGDAEWSDDG